ncbi:BglG family transcription antiterminator [Mammaliicoccus sp. Dog046]|uniref:BglG family transcription antiterminator n=1 Tax=Mammaliicoccus sp. Dog046 TaxID=3034233 RepID=UPI002B2581D2|nr:BglG family transcription antiterminator [Mammaliicoccus sp. Dog046]WQK85195.1 BglG family transcription antiterminator [Mammaliicoccus sp. Dog046]
MLSKRQSNMLSYLSSENGFVTISELALLFQVSERTIQYDLEFLESYQKRLDINVDRNKSLGVKVSYREDHHRDAQVELDIHYSKNERKEQIILRLFESSKPMSSQSLADLLNVSRRTVVDDLKSVQLWLESYELLLVYKRNKGFVIEGNEQKLREAYAHVVHEYFRKSTAQIGIDLFSKDELEKIRRAVISTLSNQDFQLVQVAIDGLIYHIIIAIHRAREDFVFEIPDDEYDRLSKTETFEIAIQMMNRLEDVFDIAFPKSEAAFITLHLLGARVNKYHDEETQHELSDLTQLLIQKVSAQIGIPLNHDHKLATGLVTHLQPAIHRMTFNMSHTNPLKNEILKEYYDLVLAIQQHIWILEENYQVTFNEDEIAYLALHFASSIERLSNEEVVQIKVILLCGSGIGTSQLLKSRITNIYPELEILDAFSAYDISERFLKSHGVDYMISTVPVEGFSVPTIEVSPFLTKEDRNKINEMINDYRERFITSYTSVGPNLKDVLPERYIHVESKASSRDEAIQMSVQTLVDAGDVNKQYGEDIMHHLDKFGPYMVIGPNIALLHSNFDHVNVPVSMAITQFKDGIDFGHDRFDPVKVIVVLATSHPKMHLNALGQLSRILMDEKMRNAFIEGSKENIIKTIQYVSESEEGI